MARERDDPATAVAATAWIDAYLAALSPDKRAALQALRETIAAAAPEAVEAVSYGAPAFRYRGRQLVSYMVDPHTIRIESSAGKINVTDGPYTEAKEAVVGWAIVEVGSKDEAIELSKRFWQIVGDGTGTIQRIYDPGETPGS